VDERHRRYGQPEVFPYAAGRHTLHRTGCSAAATCMWAGGGGRPTGRVHASYLSTYSHLPEQDRDVRFESHFPYPDLVAMTGDEARRWVDERIGPKGGRNYKLCRVCCPQL
jgi:hypothetical protein